MCCCISQSGGEMEAYVIEVLIYILNKIVNMYDNFENIHFVLCRR